MRELCGKQANRVDVRGTIMSMSGFTAGAVQKVMGYVGNKVITHLVSW